MQSDVSALAVPKAAKALKTSAVMQSSSSHDCLGLSSLLILCFFMVVPAFMRFVPLVSTMQ